MNLVYVSASGKRQVSSFVFNCIKCTISLVVVVENEEAKY